MFISGAFALLSVFGSGEIIYLEWLDEHALAVSIDYGDHGELRILDRYGGTERLFRSDQPTLHIYRGSNADCILGSSLGKSTGYLPCLDDVDDGGLRLLPVRMDCNSKTDTLFQPFACDASAGTVFGLCNDANNFKKVIGAWNVCTGGSLRTNAANLRWTLPFPPRVMRADKFLFVFMLAMTSQQGNLSNVLASFDTETATLKPTDLIVDSRILQVSDFVESTANLVVREGHTYRMCQLHIGESDIHVSIEDIFTFDRSDSDGIACVGVSETYGCVVNSRTDEVLVFDYAKRSIVCRTDIEPTVCVQNMALSPKGYIAVSAFDKLRIYQLKKEELVELCNLSVCEDE